MNNQSLITGQIGGNSTIQRVPVSALTANVLNPRAIDRHRLDVLKKSLQDFPQMLEARPLIVNKDLCILGGNMRFKALSEFIDSSALVPVIVVDWSEKQQKEFIIKDNLNYGVWQPNKLSDWNPEDLVTWGFELPDVKFEDITQLSDGLPVEQKIDLKLEQEDSMQDVEASELYDDEAYRAALEKIEELPGLNDEDRYFLELAATKLIKFKAKHIEGYYRIAPAHIQFTMQEIGIIK